MADLKGKKVLLGPSYRLRLVESLAALLTHLWKVIQLYKKQQQKISGKIERCMRKLFTICLCLFYNKYTLKKMSPCSIFNSSIIRRSRVLKNPLLCIFIKLLCTETFRIIQVTSVGHVRF